MSRWQDLLLVFVAAVLTALAPSPAVAGEPVTVAVADFDYGDTSGEVVDQTASHRDRMVMFAAALRDRLVERGYRVVRPACPQPACTAAGMAPGDLVAAARHDGARYLVYGGIRKMSTLVQWGEIQLLDLQAEKLLMRRTVTFRGDNDAAYRHAANFVGDQLKETMPKP